MLALLAGTNASALDPWPAEPLSSAINLTEIEGPGVNDFYNDLSGAVWNPVTRTLWVCRNGPGGSASKLWAIVEDGSGGYEVDSRDGNRGEWTGFGDFEGVTQADFEEDVIYAIVEGEERIKEYDVSTYGAAVLTNDWNTSSYLPLSGGSGAEGITFVPDSCLAAAGFVDADGLPRVSGGGMGGLMFVAHQNGGNVFVFDLDRLAGGFTFVGEYGTGYSETAALEFDRSTGELYAWHDAGFDVLSVFDLASSEVLGESRRELTALRRFSGPSSQNNEGIAVVSADDCFAGSRSLFMTVDDGGESSLLCYREFEDGCSVCVSVGVADAAPWSNDRLDALPNPFTNETAVSFLLRSPSDVCLGVFDLAGREVRSLHASNRSTGRHTVIWDGRDRRGEKVGSGVYLMRLQANGRVVGRRKAIVLR